MQCLPAGGARSRSRSLSAERVSLALSPRRPPGLAITPVEWSKVAVVGTAGLIPVEAKDVQMAVGRLRQREARVRWMRTIVDVQRLPLLDGARHTFNGLI